MRIHRRRAPVLFAPFFLVFGLAVIPCAGADDVADDHANGPTTLSLQSTGRAEPNDDRAFRWGLRASWMYGPAEGQLQTPTGGEPGTTSSGRPTLDELGIDDASLFAAELTLARHRHELFIAAQWKRLSGDVTLEQTLLSQGVTFPAGSRVESEVKLDTYRLGYRYRIDLGRDESGRPLLHLYPSAGIAVLDFDMELHGDTGARMGRSYAKGAPDLGLRLEWPATDRLLISADFSSSLSLSKLPLILIAKIEGTYTLVERGGLTIGATAGVAYEVIRYDDRHKQPVPNNIKADFGPMLLIGLDVRF